IEQHRFIIGALQQLVVYADFADLVDDEHGVGQLGRGQHFLEQGGLAAAEKARYDDNGRARIRPHAYTVISMAYSPPAWRSTANTMPRSSTNTSLNCMDPAGEPAGASGTK